MQAAILAGGLATRLRPITEKMPKSMVQILGKPFLQYQLEMLRRRGVRRAVLCVGHLSERIEARFGDGSRFGVELSYSREGERLLGTGGALKLAEGLLDDEFFVMYGDSYVFVDFRKALSAFHRGGLPAMMVVYKNRDRLDRSNAVVSGGMVKVYDKRRRSPDMVYIDYGVSLLRKSLLERIPPGRAYPLEHLVSRLACENGLMAFEVRRRFYEIGSFSGLGEFTRYVSSRKRKTR